MCSGQMPTFSIIVPVYNAGPFLERCISSILNQTYQEFELLLINDGSTDSSGIICDAYAQYDCRIRVFHKSNGGVSSARNLGLNHARGEWIVFCDSDDWVLPEWLKNFNDNIRLTDFVCQGIRFDHALTENTSSYIDVGINYIGGIPDFLDKMLEVGIVGYTFNKSFKNRIIKENYIRFDTRFNFREDEDFVLKYMAYSNSVIAVENVGYHYMMPNFEQKYSKIQNPILLYISLYSSADRIAQKYETTYRKWTINKIMQVFLEEFDKTESRNQRKYILEFKKLVNKDVLLLSYIFPLTKYAIVLDSTGILSVTMVRLHNMVKRIKNRLKL